MIKLFRWILGYVKFTFSGGFYENFLTDCFSDGIDIHDVALNDDGFSAYCNIKVYKKLHKYAFKHGGVVKIRKKYGLPFITGPLKNRIGFFVGMVMFVFLLSFLGSFVWNVEVTGNNRISTATVLSYLENNNLKSGVMWSSVDRDNIAWDMMSDFDDISWVRINKIGTTARIEINETSVKPDKDEEKLQGINIYRKELETQAYREQKDMAVKTRKTYKSLRFFSISIPLYLKRQSGDITEESSKFLTIKDTELPIGINTYDEVFYSSVPRTLDDDELTKLARQKLSYLEQQEFDGFEVINKTEDVQIDDDKCIIKSSYIIRRK